MYSPKDFTPYYSPYEMLKMGVFEGKYINNIKGLPSSWYKHAKVLKPSDKPKESINFFKVKSRQPLSVWKEKGWIKTDENGWFHWYCLYYLGRRLGEEDQWQINRWISFCSRHQGAIVKAGVLNDLDKRVKQRQALLQWGWNSTLEFNEENRKRAAKRVRLTIPNTSQASLKF